RPCSRSPGPRPGTGRGPGAPARAGRRTSCPIRSRPPRRPGWTWARNYNLAMSVLRALGYFLREALTSLWRSRLINALSIGTMAVSLFVLGAFLTVASNLNEVVTRWTQKVQVTFYLADGLEDRIRDSLFDQLHADPAVESVVLVSRAQALDRFRSLFRDLRTLPEDLGSNPFPASLEVSLRAGHQSPEEVQRLVHAFEKAPGVEEVQYDLLWIERLSTA